MANRTIQINFHPKYLGGVSMGNDCFEERLYKATWHLLIAGFGLFELKHNKSKFSKMLSMGLIAFHIDGAVSDWLNVDPLSKRVLISILGRKRANRQNSSSLELL